MKTTTEVSNARKQKSINLTLIIRQLCVSKELDVALTEYGVNRISIFASNSVLLYGHANIKFQQTSLTSELLLYTGYSFRYISLASRVWHIYVCSGL